MRADGPFPITMSSWKSSIAGIEHLLDRRAASRCTSSMNSTSPSSRFVRIAARSPARSSAGPLVGWIRAPISVGDDAGQRRLAQPRRAGEQHVIDGLPALPRRGQHDLEVLAQARLTDELVEARGRSVVSSAASPGRPSG